MKILSLWIFSLLILGTVYTQQKPITPEELYNQRQPGTFDITKNGSKLVYSLKQNDLKENKSSNTLYIVDDTTSGEDSKPLTTTVLGRSDHSPLFHPQGDHVFFLSNRGGSSEIYAINVDEGEESIHKVSDVPLPITTFKVSENYIIFTLDIHLECEERGLWCSYDKNVFLSLNPLAGTVYNQLYIRHWDEWKVPGKVSHVFIQRIKLEDDVWATDSNPIDVMKGMNADSPVPPFGGSEQYDFSPNENQIAFTLAHVREDTAWTTNWEIYTADIVDNQVTNVKHMSTETTGRAQDPKYSPDGSLIGFLESDVAGDESDSVHISTYNVIDEIINRRTHTDDMSFATFEWFGMDSIVGTLDHIGNHSIALVTFTGNDTDDIEIILADGYHASPLTMGGDIFYGKADFVTPRNFFRFNLITKQETQLTFENKGNADKYGLKHPTVLYYPSTIDDVEIHGNLFYPYGFEEGKKYPLLVLIHGGPESAFTNTWGYGWNPQIWASQYAVLQVNPRGSTGFGADYRKGVVQDWGGKPFQDIMDVLDNVLEDYDFIDQDRIAAAGGSFGGYMINWIAGQTNRFKALVNHDGIFDTAGLFYSTEELFFPEHEFGGTPWERKEFYDKWNPRNHVQNWETPMLVIQGDKDYRVVNAQSLSTFSALQRLGIRSKLLFFHYENHWVLNASNSVQWYNEIFKFINESF